MTTRTPLFEVESMSSESSTDNEIDVIHRNHHWVRHGDHDHRAGRLSRRPRPSRRPYPVPITISPPNTSTTSQTASPSLQTPVTASIAPPSRVGRPVYVGVVNIGDSQAQSSSSKSQVLTQQSRNWNAVDDRASANAIAICDTGRRAHSEHSHHCRHRCCSRHRSTDQPHIPPKDEEAKLTRADEREKRDNDKQLKRNAIRDYQFELIEKEKERKQILLEAKLEAANKKAELEALKKVWEAEVAEKKLEEAKKKAELEALKKAWEAEVAKKKLEEEAAKKKREAEFEQELKERMAKVGYHNAEIQKVVEGKDIHYCHEHQRPYPCSICVSKTTVKETVGKNFFGCKVRKDKICTETLRYFGLLYENDPVSVSSCTVFQYQAWG